MNLFFLCSDEPLQLGEMYCIGITGRTDVTDWSGALRLGVTTEVRPFINYVTPYAYLLGCGRNFYATKSFSIVGHRAQMVLPRG